MRKNISIILDVCVIIFTLFSAAKLMFVDNPQPHQFAVVTSCIAFFLAYNTLTLRQIENATSLSK